MLYVNLTCSVLFCSLQFNSFIFPFSSPLFSDHCSNYEFASPLSPLPPLARSILQEWVIARREVEEKRVFARDTLSMSESKVLSVEFVDELDDYW